MLAVPGRRNARTPLERWTPPGRSSQGRRQIDRETQTPSPRLPSKTISGSETRRNDRHGETEATSFATSIALIIIPTIVQRRLDESVALQDASEKYNAVIENQGTHGRAARACRHRQLESSSFLAETKLQKIHIRSSTPSTCGRPDCRPRRPQGSVTISTNMAGRGTDIKLGEESPGWRPLCRGTERHESPHRPPASRTLRPPE